MGMSASIPLTRENVESTSVISGLSTTELHEALDLVEPHGYSTTIKVWSLEGEKRATILQEQAKVKK